MVNCEGALRKAFCSKNYKSHSVVWTAIYKVNSNFLGCFKPVGLEVHGLHTTRDNKGYHYINTLGCHILQFVSTLRPGQCYDYKDQGQHPKYKGYVPEQHLA